MNIKIFSVYHKPYYVPNDALYEPIQVGFGSDITNPNTDSVIIRDNTGDNIAAKNKNYCELTALYWIWKNIDLNKYDYIGLDHYRRHFVSSRFGKKQDRVILQDQINKVITKDNTEIIIPKKRHYWIETNYSQYVHAHHEIDLQLTEEALSKLCPEYLSAYKAEMKKTSGHRFNMFIMKADLLKAYCEWLFPILSYVESHIDISTYSDYDARIYGFIGERLLDVWLEKNKFSYKDQSYVFMDSVNWAKKIANFIKHKFKNN